MKLPHYLILALSLLTVILGWILAQDSSGALVLPATALAGITTIAQIVHTILSLSTDSVSTEAAKKRALAAATGASGLVLFALVVGAVSLSGCAQLKAALPELDAIEATVVKDLAANDTDGQIAADVCQILGGSSTADAVCDNVTNIVVDVVQTLLDSGVLAKSNSALVEPARKLLDRARASGRLSMLSITPSSWVTLDRGVTQTYATSGSLPVVQ